MKSQLEIKTIVLMVIGGIVLLLLVLLASGMGQGGFNILGAINGSIK